MKTQKTTLILVLTLFCSGFLYCQSIQSVSGDYVTVERTLVKQGQILRFPFRGESVSYGIVVDSDQTATITQSVYVRGRRTFQQSFKVTLSAFSDRVEFVEIWESGELQANGYIVGNQLVITTKERLTNYVVSKDIALK